MATVGARPSVASSVVFATDVATLLDGCRTADVAAVGVDIPIGFAADGFREAEQLARSRLGRRACTLFTTPAHTVLAIDDWTEALSVQRSTTGKGFTKQAYHLLPRSREIRAALGPGEQPWCSEVHPDSSFTAMNGGETPVSKHTVDGRRQRLDLVTKLVAADAAERIACSGTPSVDTLDAYAAAWTAARLAAGTAEILGAGTDPDGYSLAIAV